MDRRRILARVACVFVALDMMAASPARAEPVACRKAMLGKLFAFQRVVLKKHEKCRDLRNLGDVASCPDTLTTLKIDTVRQKVTDKIAVTCTMADLAALGFPTDCVYETATAGVEAGCAALPVTTPGEFSVCLQCWKEAELKEFLALLYPSQALDVCGGALDETSPLCSDLDCTTPLPEQHLLGEQAEFDCQKAIAKAGITYLIRRQKFLEKCFLAGLGTTRADCLVVMQAALAEAEAKKVATIQAKCGNRDPVPNPLFCCQCGGGNACNAGLTRADCESAVGCQVQEGKTCNTGNNTCDPVGGNKKVTWWDNCPESNTCPGAPVTTLQELIDCVDASADTIVDELLCLQLRGNGGADWPCPPGSPSGAFLDPTG